MSKIEIRINPWTKEEFKKILKRAGLTMSAAIKTYIHRVVISKHIPFQVKAYGQLTQEEEQKLSVEEYQEYLERLFDYEERIKKLI